MSSKASPAKPPYVDRRMKKEVESKEDGRALIYYSFAAAESENDERHERPDAAQDRPAKEKP